MSELTMSNKDSVTITISFDEADEVFVEEFTFDQKAEKLVQDTILELLTLLKESVRGIDPTNPDHMDYALDALSLLQDCLPSKE
jgi:hypothetical protein